MEQSYHTYKQYFYNKIYLFNYNAHLLNTFNNSHIAISWYISKITTLKKKQKMNFNNVCCVLSTYMQTNDTYTNSLIGELLKPVFHTHAFP